MNTKKIFFSTIFFVMFISFITIIWIFTTVKSFANIDQNFSHSTSYDQNYETINSNVDIESQQVDNLIDKNIGDFFVYQNQNLIGRFNDYDSALVYAKQLENTAITRIDSDLVLWDNYPPFKVYTSHDTSLEFNTYSEAIGFAKYQETAFIYFRGNNSLLWSTETRYPLSYRIEDVQRIDQLPELPRGCEVTSLAMLINYMGTPVSKMSLAHEVKINEEPYREIDGKKYWGNPNDGFVGSMTSKSRIGLGVYHEPIFDLLKLYFPNDSVNLTGSEFHDLYAFISKGIPVWVIINAKYKELPKSDFEVWHTPSGEINITYWEHSVLITGYDEKNIYFSDPLGKRSSALKSDFIKSWEQMGSQAISIAR